MLRRSSVDSDRIEENLYIYTFLQSLYKKVDKNEEKKDGDFEVEVSKFTLTDFMFCGCSTLPGVFCILRTNT